jgi:hypothetical protein
LDAVKLVSSVSTMAGDVVAMGVSLADERACPDAMLSRLLGIAWADMRNPP